VLSKRQGTELETPEGRSRTKSVRYERACVPYNSGYSNDIFTPDGTRIDVSSSASTAQEC
jgi:hypothetical protein